jgi:hypothetical protein
MRFTDKDILGSQKGGESEFSDPLQERARKRRKEAISLDGYCRRCGTKMLPSGCRICPRRPIP